MGPLLRLLQPVTHQVGSACTFSHIGFSTSLRCWNHMWMIQWSWSYTVIVSIWGTWMSLNWGDIMDNVCLPPNFTHNLQPLDVSFMGPLLLDTDWKLDEESSLCSMTAYEVGSTVGVAYVRAARIENILNGLKNVAFFLQSQHFQKPWLCTSQSKGGSRENGCAIGTPETNEALKARNHLQPGAWSVQFK
jgi:hypothetical protein